MPSTSRWTRRRSREEVVAGKSVAVGELLRVTSFSVGVRECAVVGSRRAIDGPPG